MALRYGNDCFSERSLRSQPFLSPTDPSKPEQAIRIARRLRDDSFLDPCSAESDPASSCSLLVPLAYSSQRSCLISFASAGQHTPCVKSAQRTVFEVECKFVLRRCKPYIERMCTGIASATPQELSVRHGEDLIRRPCQIREDLAPDVKQHSLPGYRTYLPGSA